ncbi:MerR family transcriptional regulator [Pseudomonas sp. JL972]|uniref:MerR family transcriptional regulator n=1 Tax=Stutzerimonas degradans TaxID=2968968 RepID=UPI0012D9D972|nr:MerR family transcriptional regulator [Stutzerimonas degradans]MTZ14750.1 MerR family transcriptional regulator [Stutzerimonas degradans]
MSDAFDNIPADLEPGWRPIRDVARLTGVNPVTLRAWERRYGLIVPRRTAKGHRLYDDGHVQRIRDILTWLDRGVAVSQIKQLLTAGRASAPVEQNLWVTLQDELLAAVERLNERQLDDAFNRALTVYPPLTLCQHLLLPLQARLTQRWHSQFGAALERALFESWLRSKLATRIYFDNRQHAGAPLLLATLGDEPFDAGLWLTAWLVSSGGCPVELVEWKVPLAEISLALERISPRGLLLHAGHSLDADCLQRQLPRLLAEADALLVGPAVHIHAEALSQHASLRLAGDPLAALHLLQADGLLPDATESRA